MTLIAFAPFTGRSRIIDDEGWDKPTADPEKRHAALMLQHFAVGLSQRDQNFLFGLKHQRSPITPKQLKWKRDIEAKLRRVIFDAVKGKLVDPK
jgi:hypothetical protein